MRGLAGRLAVGLAAFAAAVAIALGALVVLPVNALVDDAHGAAVLERSQLAAELVRRGGEPPAGVRVVPADGLRAARLVQVGRVATATSPVGDGRAVILRAERSPEIEAREVLGLVLALVLVVGLGLVLVIAAAWAHVQRLSRVAAVARRVADGDLAARAGIGGRDEVARLGGDVDRMAGRLEALEAARREFVGKVSHDLRTPLTIIKGYAFTLERGARDLDDRRRLVAIGRETDRLAALVDDLLTLAQAGAGALHVTCAPVSAHELLEEIGERVRTLAGERGVAVEIEQADRALVFDGDRRRLGQVLINLATNAVAHSPVGTAVRLAIRPDRERVELCVEDRGCGIDPALVPQLLEPFARGGNAYGGAGLGLAIANELVLAHGGALALEPRDGGGTVARATIPRARATVREP